MWSLNLKQLHVSVLIRAIRGQSIPCVARNVCLTICLFWRQFWQHSARINISRAARYYFHWAPQEVDWGASCWRSMLFMYFFCVATKGYWFGRKLSLLSLITPPRFRANPWHPWLVICLLALAGRNLNYPNHFSWARQEHWLPRNIVSIVVNHISRVSVPIRAVSGW